MKDLSVVIAARNEEFLALTVEGILKNKKGNTEVIIVCDGNWPDPTIIDHPDVVMVYHSVSVGQRAGINEAVRLSKSKFIMKLDAHCIVDEGFDVKLMKDCKYNWTVIPRMYNLHAFDWVCTECKERVYQGPTPLKCKKCSGKMVREMIWKPRLSRRSDFMRFDKDLKFQYWGSLGERPQSKGDIADTMSFVGACFFMYRKRFWDIGGCDESFGSWGQQGTEMACKSWLSGGRVVVNKKTWFSHMFRTQGGDFGFPYPLSGRQVDNARKFSRKLFIENSWNGQVHPLSWLVDKFWPIPEWSEEDRQKLYKVPLKTPGKLTKGIVYYTDNELNPVIMKACQEQTRKVFNGKIVSVSLKPVDFGENIVLPLVRGYYSMFKQILAGLEALKTDIAFLIDHDVFYHSSHFEFTPDRKDVYYYNQNVWRVRVSDGHALHYHFYSGCCAYTDFLIKHYRERIRRIEELIKTKGECTTNDFLRMGFEAGTHTRKERIDIYKAQVWQSEFPNIDIRHKGNLTGSRWSKDRFRSQRNCQGWEESTVDKIEGWENLEGRIKEFRDL